MIAYRSAKRTVATADVLAGIDDPLTFLIEFGELEAALADQICPGRDALPPNIVTLREVSREAGRAFVFGRGNVRRALARLRLPETVEISVPEGYAWYGLTPARYIEPAERFFAEHRPRQVMVIGIRSIGTSLSAVVAAVLEQRGCAVNTYTVRPHGHPFCRELNVAEDLRTALTREPNAYYVIVDEGPGLSGSSFAAVAQALSALGIADERIVFMPAWLPDGSGFVSRGAEACWLIHARYAAAAQAMPEGALVDLSAGNWREMVYSRESQHPAVQPHHEVEKFLCRSTDSTAVFRFAGLGRYGREKLERARLLAAAGFSTVPLGLENGWLKLAFEPGRPLTTHALNDRLLDTIARYLAFRRRTFRAGASACAGELAEMIRVNTGIEAQPPVDAEVTIADGRMMPHEWIATAAGYLKTDALDHGDNHFYPGPADICWDLAGAMIEWQMDEPRRSDLMRLYMQHSGDRAAGERLPFYLLAYTAFRLGYTEVAMAGLPPSADRARFEKLHEQYRATAERESAQLMIAR